MYLSVPKVFLSRKLAQMKRINMSGLLSSSPVLHCDCLFKKMHLQPFSALCVGWISTGLVLGETRASVDIEDVENKENKNLGNIGSPSQTATRSARFSLSPDGHAIFRYVAKSSDGCRRSEEDERGWWCALGSDDGWRLECCFSPLLFILPPLSISHPFPLLICPCANVTIGGSL